MSNSVVPQRLAPPRLAARHLVVGVVQLSPPTVMAAANESAGRVKSTKTRPGSPYLKGALGISAMSAAWSKNTFFAAKYQRIKSRRGPMRALVAVEHAFIITAWHMFTDGAFYRELGADYYTARRSATAKARAISQLDALGYTVTLKPLAIPRNSSPRPVSGPPLVVTIFSYQCNEQRAVKSLPLQLLHSTCPLMAPSEATRPLDSA
jgi:hypothetical protein